MARAEPGDQDDGLTDHGLTDHGLKRPHCLDSQCQTGKARVRSMFDLGHKACARVYLLLNLQQTFYYDRNINVPINDKCSTKTSQILERRIVDTKSQRQ